MATHSSTLVWKIPWMEEPGRLQSMGLQRVGHDWVTSLYSLLAKLWCVFQPPKLVLIILSFHIKINVGCLFDKLQPHGLCSWDFPGKNTGVGCHFLLQGIFQAPGSNLCLLCWQADSLPLSHREAHEYYAEIFKTIYLFTDLLCITWFQVLLQNHSNQNCRILA